MFYIGLLQKTLLQQRVVSLSEVEGCALVASFQPGSFDFAPLGNAQHSPAHGLNCSENIIHSF